MLMPIRSPMRPMLAALQLTLPGSVFAATPLDYPEKPIRLVVPFSAGAATDNLARAVGQKYSEAWGRPVIVDNRTGGNGNIGTDTVAQATADGYTLLLTTNATIVINPNLTKLPYDPVRDFAPISQVAVAPFALIVHSSSPAKTTGELINLAKSKPGQLNFASSGAGGAAHLSAEILKKVAGLDMTHVPFKGGSPALIALAGAQVDFMFLGIMTSKPLIELKKVRALAVSSPARSPALPDVPTVAETPGLAGFETGLWYGILAPAKTDPRIVDKIYQETRRILTSEEFRKRFEPHGATIIANSPAEFAAAIKTDLAKWAAVIKSSGAKMN